MKIKSGFLHRNIAGTDVVMPTGNASDSFSGLISLNETGVLLWDALTTGVADTAELSKIITAKYDVSNEQAYADAEAFLSTLRKYGVLDE